MPVKPIRPEEVANAKLHAIPDAVIEAFNELIAEHWNNGQATVKQKDAVARITQRMDEPESEIYKRGWLDIEPIYRKNGWSVEYDKPGYCETYDAYYVFKRK